MASKKLESVTSLDEKLKDNPELAAKSSDKDAGFDDLTAVIKQLQKEEKEDGTSSEKEEYTGTKYEDMSDDEKKEVEDLSETLKDEDIKNGVFETDMSVMTDGLAYTASQHTSSGEIVQTTNVNDVNQETDEESKQSDSLFGNAGNLLDRGLVSFGEYKILKMVTGNTLLSAGITFGGQMLGILPKSLKPVLTTVAGFVGKDSTLGKGLNSLAEKLPDSSSQTTTNQLVVDSQDKAEKAIGDNTIATSDARVVSGMKDALTSATSDKTDDITKIMTGNGSSVAKDGILVSCANKDANDTEFKVMNDMTMLSSAALEEKADAMVGSDGKMSDENKKALASEYMTVMNGLAAYDNGAEKTLAGNYSGDDLTKGKTGLSRVMKATTAPFYDSMKELNEKYDFLSKDDIQKLDDLSINGVDKFSEYEQGTMYTYVESKTQADDKTAKTADGTAISDEDATIESRNTSTSKSVDNQSRGTQAESVFADILGKDKNVASELEM